MGSTQGKIKICTAESELKGTISAVGYPSGDWSDGPSGLKDKQFYKGSDVECSCAATDGRSLWPFDVKIKFDDKDEIIFDYAVKDRILRQFHCQSGCKELKYEGGGGNFSCVKITVTLTRKGKALINFLPESESHGNDATKERILQHKLTIQSHSCIRSKKNYKNVVRCLVVGPSGVGKSSFINTLYTSMLNFSDKPPNSLLAMALRRQEDGSTTDKSKSYHVGGLCIVKNTVGCNHIDFRDGYDRAARNLFDALAGTEGGNCTVAGSNFSFDNGPAHVVLYCYNICSIFEGQVVVNQLSTEVEKVARFVKAVAHAQNSRVMLCITNCDLLAHIEDCVDKMTMFKTTKEKLASTLNVHVEDIREVGNYNDIQLTRNFIFEEVHVNLYRRVFEHSYNRQVVTVQYDSIRALF